MNHFKNYVRLMATFYNIRKHLKALDMTTLSPILCLIGVRYGYNRARLRFNSADMSAAMYKAEIL